MKALVALTLVLLACARSTLVSESDAFCSLVEFKPECNETTCSKDEDPVNIDKDACGLITDESGHITMASASNAKRYQEDGIKLPDSVHSLEYLKSLYLYNSGLSALPDNIRGLGSLEKLFLHKNSLTTLPDVIGSLTSLKTLSLFMNSLTSLPSSLSNLEHLTKLDLNYNQDLEDISSVDFSRLTSLQKVTAFSCSLKRIPESFSSLTSLKILDLSYNRIESLPQGLGSLSKLKTLDLSYCSISSIPQGIGNLYNLKKINLVHNKLTELPDSFSCLLKNNGIEIKTDIECMNIITNSSTTTRYLCGKYQRDSAACNRCPICSFSNGACSPKRTQTKCLQDTIFSNITSSSSSSESFNGTGGAVKDSDNDDLVVYVAIAVGCLLFIIIVVVIVLLIIYRRRDVEDDDDTAEGEDIELGNRKHKTKNEGLANVGSINYEDLTFGKVIGKGGFGSVYKGTHKKTVVAIKEAISLFTPEEKEEFIKECVVMSELISEYIVQFLGVVETREKLCIVTEYMPLGSLDKAFIKKKEAFTPRYKLRVAKDITKGIKFLHDNGIVHRDIKPGNVLISSFSLSSPVVCKICDFGTSKIGVHETNTAASMTKGVGTPQYMAPEILVGTQSYKYAKALDVYSYSILLLEIWEVRDVFGESGMSHFEICKFVIDGNRLEIPECVDSKISKLITMCWAQKPEDRPSFEHIDKYLEDVDVPK